MTRLCVVCGQTYPKGRYREHVDRLGHNYFATSRRGNSAQTSRNEYIVRQIVEARRTLDDVGREMNMTRERVRQIVRKTGITIRELPRRPSRAVIPMSACSLCGELRERTQQARYVHARKVGHPLLYWENPERDGKILALARSGMFAKDIASQLGMTRMAVYSTLHRLGFWPRAPLPKHIARNDRILALAAKGTPRKTIAREVGLSGGTIQHIIATWLAREANQKAANKQTIEDHKARLRRLIAERRNGNGPAARRTYETSDCGYPVQSSR